ncbi:putative spatacsin [Helianthus annuus]|uniref:Spatacsin n=2 Tax=Helianthus annuus TaxID=4232 RepID=A0A9K3NBQ0_HELAN|nr:putative spatacsin [Helianthus annuus]KAJ0538175.1 putative spatacsin [Helianthus annuus]KAJ0721726.1 putative spatacsin [Helianthus annuus]
MKWNQHQNKNKIRVALQLQTPLYHSSFICIVVIIINIHHISIHAFKSRIILYSIEHPHRFNVHTYSDKLFASSVHNYEISIRHLRTNGCCYRRDMTSSFGEEGPAIVQLHKWEPSCLQLNLTQFREAFLSPTRELILLLSYHHEALLLPLVKGVRVDDHHINFDPVDTNSLVGSNSYPMLSDINSLAWGICEDSNNDHEGASFRELLFVVGDHGLTVHAFCQPSQCYESVEPTPDRQDDEGIWVEWGPSTSRDAMHLDKDDDNVENGEPRKWLKTFLTKVKTVKTEGKLYSRFPDKSQFPSSTKVVSFNIFENDSTLLRFILNKNTELDPEGDENEINISYKCCRVFVNNSHDLIGFVLTCADESDRKQRKNVLVGKIVSWGIQWITSVKLDEDVYTVPVDQWTDFKFLDKYLICLNSTGQIHFFGDITGEYMGCVNLLEKLSYQNNDIVGKSVFRTLLVASRTSLLAAVDDYGIVYVTRASDLLSEINNTVEKPLPQFQQLKYRTLVGWEVGGADISHQRLYDNLSPNIKFVTERSLSKDEIEDNESVITGFSAASQIVGHRTTDSTLRSIFLPPDKYSKDDAICLSPFGITRLRRNRIIHFNLHLNSAVNDDTGSNIGREVTIADAVGCVFHGCFYLVTADSLSVVLPSIAVASGCIPVEAIGFRQNNCRLTDQSVNLIEIKGLKQPWPTWKLEVLDRVLLYEGHEEADHLCSENGWDLKVSRIRRLQLALDYLNFQEIEISLELLAGVSLAEEGILRLVFAAVYLMLNKGGNDNDVSSASRLLSLGTRFSTKMIRSYGSLQHMQNEVMSTSISGMKDSSHPLLLADKEHNETENLRRLQEMAHLLEIIRNMQCRLATKFKKSVTRLGDGLKPLEFVDSELSQDDPNVSSIETNEQERHALKSMESLDSRSYSDLESLGGASISQIETSLLGRRGISFENPKDMIRRWDVDNLDQKEVVKDALLSGRLPLAVLKLHLHNQKGRDDNQELHDTFEKVRDIGRAIAYDLFLKGEIELGVTTLQKLGEDLESCLRQLVFGTVRRSLRKQITEVMKIHGYLGPYESKILEGISFIERVYPCSSFSGTFRARQKELMAVCDVNSPEEIKLSLLHSLSDKLTIECGELDGVVLGLWRHVSKYPDVSVIDDDDDTHDSYWAAAAVWSDAWDQRIIDRIVLDRLSVMDLNVSWESQFEYHISHSKWEEASRLIDIIPSYSSSHGNLRISLDGIPSTSAGIKSEFGDYGNYIYSIQDLDAVYTDVPDIKILRFPSINTSSIWLKSLVESQLAKKFIFLKEFWEGTEELVCLLARSGFVTNSSDISLPTEKSTNESTELYLINVDDVISDASFQGLHKLFLHHCIQLNLPYLLDLYLDHHKLAIGLDLVSTLLEAAGDCQWAKWLLLSRVKGSEYEASFSNARAVASHNFASGNTLGAVEIDDIIHTVDDIAEGAGEMAAIATLMYAPVPIQDCLSTGSVDRNRSSSAQCTLENLRPAIQRYPTLWRTLVAACFGQDPTCNYLSSRSKVFGNSYLSDYLNWRDNIFYSAGLDTSLEQMLPGWFSKAVRRLVQLYVQGPLGWQSVPGMPMEESFLLRDVDYVDNGNEQIKITTLSWEAAIQRHVEELYGPSLEGSRLGLEHHLHRGRALAAFMHLLSLRVKKLKLEYETRRVPSDTSVNGQSNIQSDVHTLLSPITPEEESLLSSVMPLAVMHFEDSVLVASCAFLLELCGLSPSMLQVDVAALRRISSFFKSIDHTDNSVQPSFKGSAFLEGDITGSMARALAEYYLKHYNTGVMREKDKDKDSSTNGKQANRALVLVLQNLEKASLPSLVSGETCGSWLMSGNGDGADLRAQQKAASQHWSLVTEFCKMHQIPMSTKYLAVLAKDNDWVGFLSEAQVEGHPFDTVIQVASKEFSDPCLKVHITTVLKGMQSRKNSPSSSNFNTTNKKNESSFLEDNNYIPVELFGIIADCEKQKNPGETLLLKAKDLCWSVLAMVAACFPDVSALCCLTVWLEITAAREITSIKVNDIASQISSNVAAAVDANNLLPVTARAQTLHYNRRNPKRRRLMESWPNDTLTSKGSDASTASSNTSIFIDQGIIFGGESKETTDENKVSTESDKVFNSLSKMVAVLCEQRLFLPLLRAFEMFLPSCSLLPFIRALQAFSQMRLTEASAHLGSFSARIKEEHNSIQTSTKDGPIGGSLVSVAEKASDAMLMTCPSPYEKRCLLQLLSATDFGDGGSLMSHYRRLYWKISLAEPLLRKDDVLLLGNESLDDASLLTALETNGYWEQARNWAKQLEASGGPWKSATHHVTETQAESMVAEWKEFLWDVPEERVALWGHCQMLFVRYAFPPLQAGLFFLKHAEAVDKDLPPKELHELLLLSLQWLSGMITQSAPVYPSHLLRELETRVWLLAVESEAQVKSEGELTLNTTSRDAGYGKGSSIVDHTASVVSKMDTHINTMKTKNDHHRSPHVIESTTSTSTKSKRRAKAVVSSRKPFVDAEKVSESEDISVPNNLEVDSKSTEVSFSRWEESIGPAELERAVLSLLEFGQISAARQLQHKLSPSRFPSEFTLVDAALKLAAISTPSNKVAISMLDDEVRSVIQSYNLPTDHQFVDPMQVLESLTTFFVDGRGRGLCKRLISVVKAANVLGLTFSEAFDKQPIELLQLLSLKAQDSFEEAHLLIQTHSMPAASIAQILAESFLKGLLAAHRGGYIDSQKEEGPAPLLWRFSDFLKWAELCPSESEIGHALMRLVITGQEIPHACEVELLILSHHFYKSSACLDGVDVLVALAATRVDAYVSEGDFPCLARLITGVGNFHALNFILGILIENGQLELLLQKYSAVTDTHTGTAQAVRGFRMAVLTSLKQFNPNDLDAFAMVYNHFDMKHETASLLESRAEQSYHMWFSRNNKDHTEDLLESMRYFIEAAEVHSSIDAGNKTRAACASASLVSLQIRMPDFQWLSLSATNARRALVEQSRFQEALIVAEAYGLNQPGEWALVLWNQMLKPELTEQFVAEFVAVLPLHPTMLAEIARFYRAEVAARGDQSQFSVWLTGGGLPAEWAKYLERSFRCLLKRTRDLRLRLQLATVATGFADVIAGCLKALDRVPDNGGPLVLRKGHGGAYLPLM